MISKNALLFFPACFFSLVISIHAASLQPQTCRAGTLGERLQNFPATQNSFFLHQSQFGSCHGRVKTLRFIAYLGEPSLQSSTAIYVSFWRPSGPVGAYKAIGKAAISSDVTRTTNGHFEYNAMSDNITVQPGDRMGVWQEGPSLRLLYATPPNVMSLFMPLNPMVRSAALGTTDTSVFFSNPSSRETAVMEVELLLPTSDTVVTPSPSITVDPSSLVPSTSNSLNHSSSASHEQTSFPNFDRTSSTNLDRTSSAAPSSSTSTLLLVSSTVLYIDTSVLLDPSSSVSVTELPLHASPTKGLPPSSTAPLSPSSTVALGTQEGVGEFPLIPVAAGAAGGLLLVLVMCVCVVLCTLLRQWKVKGRPFKSTRDEELQPSAVLASMGVVTSELRTRAQSHIYHIVDRESQLYGKTSSEASETGSRHDSGVTRVSRSSSVAANPLYEVTSRLTSVSSICSSPPAKGNAYMYSPTYASTYGTANKRKPARGDEESPGDGEEVERSDDDDDDYWSPPTSEVELYSIFQNKKFGMIPSNEVRLLAALGEGQFGTVSQGLWQKKDGEAVSVAVKVLRSTAKVESRLKFLQEAAIMGQFLHPNIVRLYGVVLTNDPVMIVLELLREGDLRGYLLDIEKMNPLPPQEELQKRFLEFSQQVASGMNYLSNKGFIHRDLAARNILMADQRTCKIGDFGMARDLINDSVYVASGGRVPVKWTALEALQYCRYSTASDVWSYGILLYEIWALGVTPYNGMVGREVISLLRTGQRLTPPPGCPRGIYDIMMKCWHPDPSYRPSFSTLLLALNNLYDIVITWGHSQSRPEYFIGELLSLGARLHEDLQNAYQV